MHGQHRHLWPTTLWRRVWLAGCRGRGHHSRRAAPCQHVALAHAQLRDGGLMIGEFVWMGVRMHANAACGTHNPEHNSPRGNAP